MKNFGFVLMAAGLVCMAAGAGGNDSETCTLWVSVMWVITGMVIGFTGAKMVEYGK